MTTGSDVDWTLLLDGQAYASHLEDALEIERRLEGIGLKEPGREGTFGGLAYSHELVHQIGGGEDTNRNTTQRILLLLESSAVGDASAYQRVLQQLLKRYVSEDYGWMHGRNVSNVPRFLQNDIVRYWRTVAVDFAYKRRERQGKGWALRTAKLRLSRKLTYVTGLVSCYSCALLGESLPAAGSEDRSLAVIDHLAGLLRRPPLEIVADALERYLGDPAIASAARELFGAYDEFLALLDDEQRRSRLDKLAPDAADADPDYTDARQIGHRFQDALTKIFVDPNETHLYKMSRIYGVF